MKKILSIILSSALIIGTLAGCTTAATTVKEQPKTGENAESKMKVIVSFNPLKEFAEAVGKDKIEVITVVPQGVEPHDFEPKIKDMENISNADLFVYTGFGMEGWVDKTLEAINNKDLIVVDSSIGIDPIKSEEDEHDDEEEDDEEEDDHGEFDPHIWLSLREAKIQTKNIKDALVKADAANSDFYEKNFVEYTSELDKLYEEYKVKFDGITNKNFVTGHAAFGYLCRDFELIQNSVEGVFSAGEPTAQKLKQLIDLSKESKIKVIFMEELASASVSETIANAVGAEVQKIYTIESSEDNKSYIQSMEENLSNIYNSLK